jgi:hypothetical protein
MRTATIHRSSEPRTARSARTTPGSSDSTTTGARPVTSARIGRVGARRGLVGGDDQPAGVRHAAGAVAGEPPVGGGEHGGDPLPAGSRAVRHARAVCSAVSGSPSRAVISSPALVRQLDIPE